jgi:hypothetical protein
VGRAVGRMYCHLQLGHHHTCGTATVCHQLDTSRNAARLIKGPQQLQHGWHLQEAAGAATAAEVAPSDSIPFIYSLWGGSMLQEHQQQADSLPCGLCRLLPKVSPHLGSW